MREILADRFVPWGRGHFDLASGAPVRVRVQPAPIGSQQMVWADRCASLARLRHPLLHALVDYGAADRDRLFEAFALAPPLAASGAPAVRLVGHVTRFLEAHALPLRPGDASHVSRAVAAVPGTRGHPAGRPLGIVLQSRPALEAIGGALRDAAPGGVATIDIGGVAGSGLRTLWMLAARAARLEGYVPVAAGALVALPWLGEVLLSRHVALFVWREADRDARLMVSAFVARLGAASTRRHVLIRFCRREDNGGGMVHVDRMGGTAMQAMVYLDRDDGPSLDEVLDGIRDADGLPGTFIERLRGVRRGRRPGAFALVHEFSPDYAVAHAPPDAQGEHPHRRIGAGLRGAPARAARLAANGRHGAAVRLLERALRVFAGRGEPAEHARCGLTLGWILRDRGRSGEAVRRFEHARECQPEGRLAIEAAIATGIAWTDDDRLEEGEALLRSAQSAAALLDAHDAVDAATLALARCVLWRGGLDEAAALLSPSLLKARPVEAWSLAARIHVTAGDVDRGLHSASAALAHAEAAGIARGVATAARAMALARGAAGDAQGACAVARQGLAAAAAAHLPLAALRLRAAWLQSFPSGDDSSELRHLRACLTTALARPLPALLRRQLDAAYRGSTRRPAMSSTASDATLSDLRQWLETTQTAPDDQAALQLLADALLGRLRAATVAIFALPDTRTIVRSGRPWSGDPTIALQALACGAPARSRAVPAECAAPIRYGGEAIGALACRWSAGIVVHLEHAAAACAAAALAAAASLRSLVDRTLSAAPDATGDDLLGTSPSAAELRRAMLNAARAPFPVLILGESGSGKELVARAIHRLGPRRSRRLCTVNCAAISDELVEAELFGHTRGAFTGASSERAGLFEEADGGTLFLDEVGELSARAQAKLLRVLQDGEVRRVGENLPRRVDTRVIAATNRSLEHEIEAGRFRADLRFRLDVIRIAVPPLRDRATDIPALVAYFWEDAAARVGSRATLAPETVAALTRYDWPGNVRELQNAVASLAVHGPRRGRITPGTLPQQVARTAAAEPASFEAARAEFERRYVRAALARAGGRRSSAARALGLSRQGLAKMLRRLGLDDLEGSAP